MLSVSGKTRIFAYTQPADLRKSYDGLGALVRDQLAQDLLEGDLFVFVNRARSRLKALYFDGTGVCILQKRLEVGCFPSLWDKPMPLKLTSAEMALLLDGHHVVGRLNLTPKSVSLSR